MKKRTVAMITGKGEAVTTEQKIPELRRGQALIRVRASLISPGTEMGGVIQRRAQPNADGEAYIFGYANAGEIVEIKGARKGLEAGMRVAAMGASYAVHGNYACVPVNLVVPIPGSMAFQDAVYACLGATALQSLRRTMPQLGEYGAVLGLGIVGNMAAQLYQLSGARVIAWEGLNGRVRIAKRCGIRTTLNIKKRNPVKATREFAAPYGLDFANIAFGASGEEAIKSVVSCMKVSADGHRMGRIAVVGGTSFTFRGGSGMGNLDIRSAARTGPGYHDESYEHGKDYPPAFVQFTTQRNLREVISLIAEKRLIVRPITTHMVSLEHIGEMADMLVNEPNKALGVVLKMKH